MYFKLHIHYLSVSLKPKLSLYIDGGGEFQGLSSYLQSHGIEHLDSDTFLQPPKSGTGWT